MRTPAQYCLVFLILYLGIACQPSGPSEPTGEGQFVSNSDSTINQSFHPIDQVLGLSEQWTGDLDSMIERRRIRALVPYSPESYYLDGAERQGLGYEAMNLFERFVNDRLDKDHQVRIVFIPTTRDRLLPALLEGYGDLVVANLTITPNRKEIVEFSTPVLTGAEEVAVTSRSASGLYELEQLREKPVFVRASSSFYEHLQQINQEQKMGIDIELLGEHLEDEEILEMVNAGLIPTTIMDKHRAQFWAQIFDSLKVHSLAIFEDGKIAWPMRKDNPQLKVLVDEFIEKNKKGTLMGNMLFNRYLKRTDYIENAYSQEDFERFKATRQYFLKYGEQYNLDWLLLAAQGFQESRLNPGLVSSAGAVGIMQIKPSTAQDPNIDVENVRSLEGNIHAGTKYLRFLIDRYFIHPKIDSLNAGLFAVAAYNAGPQRITRLQKQAEQAGLNPYVWFDNVEMLAAREIGRETVQYVSNIYKYYTSFRSLARYVEQTGKSPFEGW